MIRIIEKVIFLLKRFENFVKSKFNLFKNSPTEYFSKIIVALSTFKNNYIINKS